MPGKASVLKTAVSTNSTTGSVASEKMCQIRASMSSYAKHDAEINAILTVPINGMWGIQTVGKTHNSKSQADKFREAARELGIDESGERFDERLKRIAKSPPPKSEDAKKDKPGQ